MDIENMLILYFNIHTWILEVLDFLPSHFRFSQHESMKQKISIEGNVLYKEFCSIFL